MIANSICQRSFVLAAAIAGLGIGLGVSSAQGAIVLQDNFDAYTAGGSTGARPTYPNSPFTFVNPEVNHVTEGYRSSFVYQDTGNLFGAGTTNQYVRYNDNSKWGPGTNSTNVMGTTNTDIAFMTGPKVITMSFDFYEPTANPVPTVAGVTGTPGAFNIYVGTGSVSGNNTTNGIVEILSLKDGKLAGLVNAYTLDQKHHLDVVINESGAPINYDGPGGTESLIAGKYDVFLDGVRILNDTEQGGARTDSTAFVQGNLNMSGLNLGTDSRISDTNFYTQDMYIDNFVVQDTAAIPEPASLGLLGLAGAMALLSPRRRQV